MVGESDCSQNASSYKKQQEQQNKKKKGKKRKAEELDRKEFEKQEMKKKLFYFKLTSTELISIASDKKSPNAPKEKKLKEWNKWKENGFFCGKIYFTGTKNKGDEKEIKTPSNLSNKTDNLKTSNEQGPSIQNQINNGFDFFNEQQTKNNYLGEEYFLI